MLLKLTKTQLVFSLFLLSTALLFAGSYYFDYTNSAPEVPVENDKDLGQVQGISQEEQIEAELDPIRITLSNLNKEELQIEINKLFSNTYLESEIDLLITGSNGLNITNYDYYFELDTSSNSHIMTINEFDGEFENKIVSEYVQGIQKTITYNTGETEVISIDQYSNPLTETEDELNGYFSSSEYEFSYELIDGDLFVRFIPNTSGQETADFELLEKLFIIQFFDSKLVRIDREDLLARQFIDIKY